MSHKSKDTLGLAIAGLALALIITKTKLVESLLCLVIAGILPYTTARIPYWVSFSICIALMGYVIYASINAAVREYKSARCATLPRRRYAEITS